jgi:hypothetical protein
MTSNTSGTSNIAIGNSTLISNTTGNTNIAIGNQAGRYISTAGPNETPSNSIFIGYDTRALANNETNQIVIGHNAIGNGSNTVTIGNDSITSNIFSGNITTRRAVGTASEGIIEIRPNTGSSNIIIASGTVPLHILSTSGSLGLGVGSTPQVTIASGGATTFTSSITANSIIKSGGTSAQFLKADGSVDSTSYGTGSVTSVAALTLGTSGTDLSSTVANGTTTPVITLNVPTASASNRGALSAADWTTFNNKQNALTNPVTGTGTSGQVAYFTGTSAISSESNLFWDATNDRLGIGTNTPATTLEVNGVGLFSGTSLVGNTKNGVYIYDSVIASLAGGNSRSLQIQSQTLSIFTGTTYTEKVKVFENGNVVISTSPSDAGFKLDVNGTGRFVNNVSGGATNVLTITNAGSTVVNTETRLFLSTVTGNDRGAYISAIITSASNDNALTFATNSAGASPTEKVRITNNGNVLIGTTTNGARLTVQDAGNTFVGHFSGNNQTNGVAIGTNGSNVAVIQGYTRTFSATNNIAMQTDGGNVLIGTATDAGNGVLQVNKSTSNAVVRFTNARNTSGDFAMVTDLGSNCNNTSSYHYIAGTGGADKFYLYGNGVFATVSDKRLKKNIESVTDKFLQKVMDLNVVNYNWNEQEDGHKKEFGLIAQEVEASFPFIVNDNRPNQKGEVFKNISVSALPYILIKAIQELKEEIDTLKN